MKKFTALIAAIFAMMFTGCTEFREIPAGYIGKILTPTGWQSEVRPAGQVDIRPKNSDGSYNSLCLLEATSIAIKESFGKTSTDAEDHRIIIDRKPVTADVYIRLMVPPDDKRRNACFSQMTPQAVQGQDRVTVITLESIYNQFAKMDVRSGIRACLQKESDVNVVMKDLETQNKRLTKMVMSLFDSSGVPLLLQNVSISNLKPDEAIWAAENAKFAALAQVATIDSLGKALERHPGYYPFKALETYSAIAEKNKGNVQFLIGNVPGVVISK